MTIKDGYFTPPPHHQFVICPLPTDRLLHSLPTSNLLAHSFHSNIFWHFRNYVTFCPSINWECISKSFVIFTLHQKRSGTSIIMYDGTTEVKIHTKLQLESSKETSNLETTDGWYDNTKTDLQGILYGILDRNNLLKPTGGLMHQQFNIQQLYGLPTLYLCVLYLSENKQRLVPLTA